jgi:hypothetical protein
LDELNLGNILVNTGGFNRKISGKGVDSYVPILTSKAEQAADDLFLGLFVNGVDSGWLKCFVGHEFIRIGGADIVFREGELFVQGVEIGPTCFHESVAIVVVDPTGGRILETELVL